MEITVIINIYTSYKQYQSFVFTCALDVMSFLKHTLFLKVPSLNIQLPKEILNHKPKEKLCSAAGNVFSGQNVSFIIFQFPPSNFSN